MAKTPVDGATKPPKPPKLPLHKQPLAPPPPIDTSVTSGYQRPGDRPIQPLDTLPWGPGSEPGGPGSHVGQYATDPSAPPGPDPSVDWASAFFGALGLPDDVMNQVKTILTQHAQDQSLAQTLATQYIRSTPWYAIHYPGALEGIAKGVIGSEADYSSYLNQINILSRQYQGRDISGDEVKGYLSAGYNPGYVANLFQGHAYVTANRDDLQYLGGAFGNGRLDDAQLTALGNEQAGIDSPLGQLQQKIIQRAQQIQQRISSGTLATPSLSLGANGLSAPSLAGTKSAPDVGA